MPWRCREAGRQDSRPKRRAISFAACRPGTPPKRDVIYRRWNTHRIRLSGRGSGLTSPDGYLLGPPGPGLPARRRCPGRTHAQVGASETRMTVLISDRPLSPSHDTASSFTSGVEPRPGSRATVRAVPGRCRGCPPTRSRPVLVAHRRARASRQIAGYYTLAAGGCIPLDPDRCRSTDRQSSTLIRPISRRPAGDALRRPHRGLSRPEARQCPPVTHTPECGASALGRSRAFALTIVDAEDESAEAVLTCTEQVSSLDSRSRSHRQSTPSLPLAIFAERRE